MFKYRFILTASLPVFMIGTAVQAATELSPSERLMRLPTLEVGLTDAQERPVATRATTWPLLVADRDDDDDDDDDQDDRDD